MRDTFIIQLSEKWAILADRNQWVLAKLEKYRAQGDLRHPAVRWRGISFIGSSKTVLHRVVREKGIKVDPEAARVIETWPERFLDWRDQEFSKYLDSSS